MTENNYPFKWIPVEEELRARKLKFFPLEDSTEVDMVKSVPGDVFMPKQFADIAEKIYNFKLRPDDVWIVTYPKCGTTWTQVGNKFNKLKHLKNILKEILWLLTHDLDVATLSKKQQLETVPFIEFNKIMSANYFNPEMPQFMTDPITYADNLPTTHRRVIKSHMPLEFLPPKLLDTCKGN